MKMRNKVSFSIPSNRSAKVSPTPSPHGSLHSDHGTVSSPTSTTTSRLNTGQRPAKENLPDVAHAPRKAEPSTTDALRQPARSSVHSMPDGMANEFRNFSKDNSATHRTRVVRLLVIFAVPMIVVFVEVSSVPQWSKSTLNTWNRAHTTYSTVTFSGAPSQPLSMKTCAT